MADSPLTISAVAAGEDGATLEMEDTIPLGTTLSLVALLVRPDLAEYWVGETIAVEIFASWLYV